MRDILTDDKSAPRERSGALTAREPILAPSGISVPRFPAPPPRRRPVSWSFLLMVVLPALAGAVYYLGIAAPQYVTHAVVALRVTEDPRESVGSGPSSLMGSLGPAAAGGPVTQSYGIVDYIGSAPAIADVTRAGIDVRAILGSSLADPLTRLAPDASEEALLRAWRSMVGAQFELTRGVITLTTRAYTAEDSLALAEAVLAASERLTNEIAQRIANNALNHAEAQVAAARERFDAALAQQEAFRASSGVLDPGRASSAGVDIEMQLRQELATVEAQAENLRASGGTAGPMFAAAQARARALRAQIADVEQQARRNLGERSGQAWAAVMARNDALAVNVRIAEQQYTQALSMLQAARAEVAQQRTYLLTFVRPMLAGAANFPNRWLSVLIVAGGALIAWAMVTLLWHAIRDHA